MSCPIMFAGAPFIGEGLIHNLSETGCLIECERRVLEGSYVTARLLLPDHVRALVIELAAIRWVREHCFGIEFLRVPAEDRSRLRRFLSPHRL
ncbi:MAG: PilZ domain-containing protein [Nitrospira sp.]|nr:PilZ domain-containing protein [Nitrospira sp.]